MKRIPLIALLIVVLLYSCKTVYVYVGMPENEFQHKYKQAELIEMNSQRHVYRINVYANGIWETKFIYFTEGKLTQVDEGQRQPDVIIQHQ